MWWHIVFWILLLPLIVIEIIIYLQSRKLTWLIYALAIFSFVVTVTYVIDVFALQSNAIILILLACSGLMVLLGRQLRQKPTYGQTQTFVGIILIVILLAFFLVSVLLGKATETITPIPSLRANDVMTDMSKGNFKETVIAHRSITNEFILPVPVRSATFRACLLTTNGSYEFYVLQEAQREVPPRSNISLPIRVQSSTGIGTPTEILLFEDNYETYQSCDNGTGYRIQVT